jgi:hypothetical protein
MCDQPLAWRSATISFAKAPQAITKVFAAATMA